MRFNGLNAFEHCAIVIQMLLKGSICQVLILSFHCCVKHLV